MTKQQERDNPSSAWNNTKADEPVFVVCGRDILAPHAILDWADRAELLGVQAEKIAAARRLTDDVINWQRANRTKLPD